MMGDKDACTDYFSIEFMFDTMWGEHTLIQSI
jgi:hypothetical protein